VLKDIKVVKKQIGTVGAFKQNGWFKFRSVFN